MNRGKKIVGALAALAVAFVTGVEGTRLVAYPDPATHGAPWTACMGETHGIEKGDTFTLAECKAMLNAAITTRYGPGINRCLTHSETIPDKTYVAFLSLAYNIGIGGFCNSSVARLANAGDLRAACNRLPSFNRAAGRVNKGLVNRRAKELKLCLEGLG